MFWQVYDSPLVAANEGQPVTVNVLARTDGNIDVNPITVTVSSVYRGTARVNPNRTVTFTPNSGGVGSFRFTVTEPRTGRAVTRTARISINGRPTANAASE